MRAIAEFAMRSRFHAIGTCIVAGILPLLGWISLVIVALVCLRQGMMVGSVVLLWGMLPFALQTYVVGDPTIFSLIGIFILAGLLRLTFSWEIVLLMALFYAAIAGLLFESLVLDKFLDVYSSYIEQLGISIALSADELSLVISNSIMMLIVFSMIAMLLLARWCQAALYNTGGFKKEFQSIRLSPAVALGLLLAVLASYNFDDLFGRWLPLFTIPMVVAALGFFHWFIENRQLSTPWVIGFYSLLILFGQLVYPLLISLGIMDSLFNLRYRLKPNKKD